MSAVVGETSAAAIRAVMLERKVLGLTHAAVEAYFQRVVNVVRLVRVVLILLLACFAISFVIGLGTPETGALEKAVLLALIAACVFLAAKVSTIADKTKARLQRD